MNVSGHYSGTIETPLTKNGRAQAKVAGEMARGLDIDYIVASPLGRAQETARLIAEQIGYPADKIHTNDLFIERHFGKLEGLPWDPDLDVDGISDIESIDTTINRARLALKFLESLPHDNVLVVAHGSFGRALRSIIKPDLVYSSKSKAEDMIPNAQIVCWVEEDE